MNKVYVFANNPTINFDAIRPKKNDIVVMMGNFYLKVNPPFKIDYYILRVARKEVGALEKRSHFECRKCEHAYSSDSGFYQVKRRRCPKCGKTNKRTSVDRTARVCSLIDPKITELIIMEERPLSKFKDDIENLSEFKYQKFGMWAHINKREYGGKLPKKGFWTIYWAMHAFKDYEIVCVGFSIPFSARSPRMRREGFYPGHNDAYENKKIVELEEEGKIKLIKAAK